jgi:Mg2+-importing ATPase
MLPVQILFNNFLYDISQIPLPTDEVDKEYTLKPRGWNINYIQKFMLIIGPLSSIYDFLTFGVLIWIFKANPELFHTGWFLESLCTQILVIYVIRTNKIPFIQSRPSKALLISTLLILGFAFIIPYTIIGTYLGFVSLPVYYFYILFAMVITYLLLVQIVKMWMVKKYGYQ